MSTEERRVVAEPIEVLEDILLQEDDPEKFTRTWSHDDMLGIDPSVITHRLSMYPSSKAVRQKKRVFAPKRDKAINEEV